MGQQRDQRRLAAIMPADVVGMIGYVTIAGPTALFSYLNEHPSF